MTLKKAGEIIVEHKKHGNRKAQSTPLVAIPFRKCHTLAGNCVRQEVGQHVYYVFFLLK